MSFSVDAASARAVVFLLVMAVLPALLTMGGVKALGGGNAQSMAGIVFALTAPLFALLILQLFVVSAVVRTSNVRIGGGLYSVELPLDALKLSELRVVDRRLAPPLYLRTNGIGLPGLSLGWFKVEGRKVFAAVGKADRVVFIPTQRDFDLLVAPADADGFVAALGDRSNRSQMKQEF